MAHSHRATASRPTRPRDALRWTKPLLFALCLLPLAWLTWDVWQGTLGPDPVAQLEHRTGDWALRLLLASLAITPLRRLGGWHTLVRYRRMLGLFAFFYACLHLTTYLVVDLGGFWTQIFAEIVKRPYITVGFAAWLLLIPLAITSTNAMMRRLGRLSPQAYAEGLPLDAEGLARRKTFMQGVGYLGAELMHQQGQFLAHAPLRKACMSARRDDLGDGEVQPYARCQEVFEPLKALHLEAMRRLCIR